MHSSVTAQVPAIRDPLPERRFLWATICLLTLITLAGMFIRLRDLHQVSLSLSIDEARLVLVARGIQDQGWPVLPSGKVYTRGLPVALSIAPNLSLFGDSDFAARLPSVLFGTLLIPIVAVHAGRLGGFGAAFIAGGLVALYPPLIFWSRQAWFFSLFVLLWMLTLLGLNLALTKRSSAALMLAALATGVGLLTHELFLTLLPCWALTVIWLLRQTMSGAERARLLLLPVATVLVGLAALASFTLTHRVDTLAGRMGEVTEYLTLNTDLAGFRFYGRMLTDRYWLLLAAAIAGLALQFRPERLTLAVAIIPLFIIDAFVLPDRPQERYGLALVPPMMILAATGLTDLTTIVRLRFSGLIGTIGAMILLLGVPLIHLDLVGVARRTEVQRANGTWMNDLQRMGYRPGDVVVTDIPTITQAYLGRTDYWLVSRDYEKYTYRPNGDPREIHTNARLIRSAAELEMALGQDLSGQTVWVVGSDRSYQWQELVDRNLKRAIDDRSVDRLQSADSTRLFRLQP